MDMPANDVVPVAAAFRPSYVMVGINLRPGVDRLLYKSGAADGSSGFGIFQGLSRAQGYIVLRDEKSGEEVIALSIECYLANDVLGGTDCRVVTYFPKV